MCQKMMTNLQIILVILLPELGHIHFPVTDHGGSVHMPDRQSTSINLCRHWPVGDLWPSRITISPWAEKVVH